MDLLATQILQPILYILVELKTEISVDGRRRSDQSDGRTCHDDNNMATASIPRDVNSRLLTSVFQLNDFNRGKPE